MGIRYSSEALAIDSTAESLQDVLLYVQDTGIGMSESFVRDKLFQPFVQENTFASGSGLGLSSEFAAHFQSVLAKLSILTVCQSLVQRAGGTIEVQSKLNEGTRMTVKFVTLRGFDCPFRSPFYSAYEFR